MIRALAAGAASDGGHAGRRTWRGLWARHVHGLSLAGYDIIPDKHDPRPYLVVETDVQGD